MLQVTKVLYRMQKYPVKQSCHLLAKDTLQFAEYPVNLTYDLKYPIIGYVLKGMQKETESDVQRFTIIYINLSIFAATVVAVWYHCATAKALKALRSVACCCLLLPPHATTSLSREDSGSHSLCTPSSLCSLSLASALSAHTEYREI